MTERLLDIEHIDVNNKRFIKGQMTIEEINIASIHIRNEENLMSLLWTAKEALSKILKTGLMIPFKILEISAMHVDDGCYYTEFKNFYQYQSCSFQLENKFISIVYPRKTKIHLDFNGIRNALEITNL